MVVRVNGAGSITGLEAGGLPDNSITTAEIADAAVTAAKLSTGAPSWTSGGVLSFNSGYGSVATAYGCRAWINFNGTGAISIRDSKGVSSLTDNGTGNYNVNLSITLPDTNGVVLGNKHHSTSPGGLEGLAGASFIDTSTLRILSGDWTNTYINSTLYDSPYLMAAIIR